MNINWSAYNAIQDVIRQPLCQGEVRTLSDVEIDVINTTLREMAMHSAFIEEKFNAARERFAAKLR